MAVRIINDLPDAEIHHGDDRSGFPHSPQGATGDTARNSGRAVILILVIALHVVGVLMLANIKRADTRVVAADPIIATIVDTRTTEQAPPSTDVPPQNIAYTLPMPDSASFETDAIVNETVPTTTSAQATQALAPPLVESVEYVRAAPPVYPRESQRRREHGTVIVRVLVDETGRPADVRVERSSGYERLDSAAVDAVRKFVFRPYEVNGVAHAAQVLIPIGFDRRAS